jgi:two-component system phosphate regulon response regulator PhoB
VVERAATGEEGLELLAVVPYDIIVLDWNLPGISGPEVLRRYRGNGGVAGVIMLTGKGTIADKEVGFSTGADDYLTKPFDVPELVFRVRGLVKRPPKSGTPALTCGELTMDTVAHTLKRNNEEIKLAPRDFSLLEFLMRHPNELFHADTLVARVWQSDSTATGEAVRMAISRIRKAIGPDDANSIIENVPRLGYRLRKTRDQ